MIIFSAIALRAFTREHTQLNSDIDTLHSIISAYAPIRHSIDPDTVPVAYLYNCELN